MNDLTNRFTTIMVKPFLLLLFSLITTATFAISNELTILLQPNESARMLAWHKTSSVSIHEWRVDIMKMEEVSGQQTMVPQVQYFQEKNYLRIDPQYMTEDYFYHIYGVDASGSILIDLDDDIPVAPGIEVNSICSQECNGDVYAWKITQNCLTNGPCYLTFGQAAAWFDEDTYTTVPYYWYVSKATWDSWGTPPNINPYFNSGHKLVYFNTYDMPNGFFVKTPAGVGITGDVVGIEKKLGVYSDYSGKMTGNLASQLNCSPSLVDYAAVFNANKINCNIPGESYPVVGCVPDVNTWTFNDGNPVHTSDPTAHGNDELYIQFDFYWDVTGDGDLHPCFPNYPEPCVRNGGTFSVQDIEDIIQLSTNGSLSNNLTASDFIQFEIQKIGDPHYSLILKPQNMEQQDGSLSLSGQSFTDGLYQMNIFYSDNVIIPVYFESVTGSGSSPATLASYFNANIYAVPIVNHSFDVLMTSQKSLDYVYEVFDLNGNLISHQNYQIQSGEEIIAHMNIDPNLVLPSNMLVNKFTFADGSTFVIQTIKSIN